MGCHPTRCNEFESNPEEYLNHLKNLCNLNTKKVVAIGECGLDYDRLHFCQKDTQKKLVYLFFSQIQIIIIYQLLIVILYGIYFDRFFEYQLRLCSDIKLPLFLHCRAAWDDFFDILSKHSSQLNGGVVHSFDGSVENMKRAVEMGFYIGINGWLVCTIMNIKFEFE